MRCESEPWRCRLALWGMLFCFWIIWTCVNRLFSEPVGSTCGQTIRPKEANMLNASRHPKLQVSDLAKGVERKDNGSSYGSQGFSFERMDILKWSKGWFQLQWLLKLTSGSWDFRMALSQPLSNNWSITIDPFQFQWIPYTLNHFHRRVNENCRTRTHSLSYKHWSTWSFLWLFRVFLSILCNWSTCELSQLRTTAMSEASISSYVSEPGSPRSGLGQKREGGSGVT